MSAGLGILLPEDGAGLRVAIDQIKLGIPVTSFGSRDQGMPNEIDRNPRDLDAGGALPDRLHEALGVS